MEEMNNNMNGIEQKNNGLAIAGFVVSLVSLIINFGGIVGLVGTILSGIGLSKSKQLNGKGKGMAIAGLIIGIIGIVYGVYSIIKAVSLLSSIL